MDSRGMGLVLERLEGNQVSVSIVKAARMFDIGTTKLREALADGKLKAYDPLRSLSGGSTGKGKKLLLVAEIIEWIKSNEVQTTDVSTVRV